MVEYDFELHLRGRKVFIYFEKTQKVIQLSPDNQFVKVVPTKILYKIDYLKRVAPVSDTLK